jgi:hypothetical protein
MEIQRLIERMEAFPNMVSCAVSALTTEEARWKPPHPNYPNGAWSVLEIVNHLADEEVEDFRARIELTLRDPTAPWPKIDPEGWAVSRKYNERDMDDSMARLVTERSHSIGWLRSLGDVDWSIAHPHPRVGPVPVGHLMAAWAAHDALHLRQIAKRLHQLAERDSGGFGVQYAGPWGP